MGCQEVSFAVTYYVHLPCIRYCVPSKSCTLTTGMRDAYFLFVVATVWVQMGAPMGVRMSLPRDKPPHPMQGQSEEHRGWLEQALCRSSEEQWADTQPCLSHEGWKLTLSRDAEGM